MITGAGDGIGRVVEQIFVREGAAIIVAEISEEMGNETARLINNAGGRAIFVQTDVSIEEDVISMVQKAVDTFGHLHIHVDNAALLSLEKGRITDTPLVSPRARMKFFGKWLSQ